MGVGGGGVLTDWALLVQKKLRAHCIFCCIMQHRFAMGGWGGGGQVWTARRSVQYQHCFTTRPPCCNLQNVVWLLKLGTGGKLDVLWLEDSISKSLTTAAQLTTTERQQWYSLLFYDM